MQIDFFKYQGTGNDFIIIDNFLNNISLSKNQIALLCHRRFGIGADGLMLVQRHQNHDFEMVYFNADGNESTMCGNGGRCIAKFVSNLLQKEYLEFIAIDGFHQAKCNTEVIKLQMQDVQEITYNEISDAYILDTGSPHFVKFIDNLDLINVFESGRIIRNNEDFKEKGINVNFVEIIGKNTLKVGTYERGVEDETYSCGTGVVASVIAFSIANKLKQNKVHCLTKGGNLNVNFNTKNNLFTNIWLEGPVKFVFKGSFNL